MTDLSISEKPPADLPKTLGALRATGAHPEGVRDEIRRNLIRHLRAGDPLFPGIIGYEETVIPQIVNALLARHDILLLGLRGQAKTRIARGILDLLDPWTPVIPHDPLRSHPLAPRGAFAERIVAERGDELPIEWIDRHGRYGEKLATPDVSMADLIGDIDPLKASNEGLDLSNEEVIHFGIVPRTNRGVFTINELPDLAPRIQVGLLNILEEQDIQVRGFPLRIPLDLLFVFTANPEDYTNRGSIITPLKDRIASQVLTHYPQDIEHAHAITEQEAWLARGDELPEVRIPPFIADIVEAIAFEGRESEYIDQTSGVSARLAIAARELLVSQVERRTLKFPDADPVPRVVDLGQIAAAVVGKVELVYEGEQEGAVEVARHLVGQACQRVFDAHFPDIMQEGSEDEKGHMWADRYRPILDWFSQGNKLELSDAMSDEDYLASLSAVPGLDKVAREFLPEAFEAAPGPAMELVLEGLHQHSMLAKEDVHRGAAYSDMMGILMRGLKSEPPPAPNAAGLRGMSSWIRYLDWQDGQQRFLDKKRTLRRILSWLLIQHDGDVEEALEHLEMIAERHGLFGPGYGMEEFRRDLERDRIVAGAPGEQQLTPRGERLIRSDSLDQIFGDLKRAPGGDHAIPHAGDSGEPLSETRPYAFGDDVHDIDYARSLQNAMRRDPESRFRLTQDDLEVREREQFVSAATVLMLDISHSMILYGEDRITPAKRVALALVELIRTRYPKDALHLVLFGDDAREVPLRELPYSGVGPYHTNTHAGLRLARHILMRKKHSNRQIFMITDGKPTALFEGNELYLNPFGLDKKIVRRTLNEAAECRRYGIPITTFMLARDPLLVDFVKQLTEVNHGRAYFSSLRDLEQKVFVDFIRNRSRKVR